MDDLKWFGLIFLLLVLAWVAMRGYESPTAQYGELLDNPLSEEDDGADYYWGGAGRSSNGSSGNGSVPGSAYYPSAAPSSYRDSFYLDQGTAAYEYQPGAEYIALHYEGQSPVDITGWYLVNGNGQRLYEQNKKLVYGTAGVGVIPQVTQTLTLGGQALPKTNLVLQSGDTVVITTGYPPRWNRELAGAASGFRLNRCTGYLSDSGDYRFSPSLWSSCPAPGDWLAARSLDEECYDFVESEIGSCHTPKFKRDSEGNRTIDGREDDLSSRCRSFVEETYTYNGCVANWLTQPDFYQPEWRVFLGHTWELWAEERETISLYDRNNQLVTQIKY